jgi:outer membrane lipoprotein
MKRLALLLLLILLLSASCSHVVSKNVRQQAVGSETIPAVFKDPDMFKGRTVILGGNIISSKNTDKGTYIEVLQKPLNYRGRPKDTDFTYGRFMVFHPLYLESAIYSRGKEITVAGEVMGRVAQPLGEMEYTYPLINAGELHLFEVRRGFPIHFSIGVGAAF